MRKKRKWLLLQLIKLAYFWLKKALESALFNFADRVTQCNVKSTFLLPDLCGSIVAEVSFGGAKRNLSFNQSFNTTEEAVVGFINFVDEILKWKPVEKESIGFVFSYK